MAKKKQKPTKYLSNSPFAVARRRINAEIAGVKRRLKQTPAERKREGEAKDRAEKHERDTKKATKAMLKKLRAEHLKKRNARSKKRGVTQVPAARNIPKP